MSVPTIEVESDFDGYFERLTRTIMREKQGPYKHTTIVVSAGPWRANAVTVNRIPNRPGAVNIDFYSALRTGFGWLSEGDYAGIAELL